MLTRQGTKTPVRLRRGARPVVSIAFAFNTSCGIAGHADSDLHDAVSGRNVGAASWHMAIRSEDVVHLLLLVVVSLEKLLRKILFVILNRERRRARTAHGRLVINNGDLEQSGQAGITTIVTTSQGGQLRGAEGASANDAFELGVLFCLLQRRRGIVILELIHPGWCLWVEAVREIYRRDSMLRRWVQI